MGARFKIHPNKTATLSGINYRDLRSVFDGASIHYLDDLLKRKKRADESKADFEESVAWLKHMVKVLECIKHAIDKGIADTFPKAPTRKPTKAERFKKVKADKEFRLLIDSLI